MRSVFELRSPGGPQEHLDRVTFGASGNSRSSTARQRIQGEAII